MSTLVDLKVYPGTFSLPKGGEINYTAIGEYDDGSSENLTNSVIWVSDNESIVTFSDYGIAKAVGIGTTNIYAKSGFIESEYSSIEITPAIIYEWKVLPINPVVISGGTLQLEVKKIYSDGTIVASMPSSWLSLDLNIATVSPSGLIIGISGGGCTIIINDEDDASNPIELITSITVLSAPMAAEDQTNYVVNGQFAKFNNYIIPEKEYNLNQTEKDNPFYIFGDKNSVDGNQYPNIGKILFYRRITDLPVQGSDEFFSIKKFTDADRDESLSNEANPLYYARHRCCNQDGIGNKFTRAYECGISNVSMLSNGDCTITASILARAPLSVYNNGAIVFYIRQYNGDGLPILDNFFKISNEINCTNNFQKYTVTHTISSVSLDKITENNFFSIVAVPIANTLGSVLSDFCVDFTNIQFTNTTSAIVYQERLVSEITNIQKTLYYPDIPPINELTDINNDALELEGCVPMIVRDKTNLGSFKYEFKTPVPVGSCILSDSNVSPEGYIYGGGIEFSATKYKRLKKYYMDNNIENPYVPKFGFGDSTAAATIGTNMVNIIGRVTGGRTAPQIINLPTGSGHFELSNITTDGVTITCGTIEDIINTPDGYIKYYNHSGRIWYIIFIVDGIIKYPSGVSPTSESVAYVNVKSNFTSIDIASALFNTFNPLCLRTIDARGYLLRFFDNGAGIDTGNSTRAPRGGTGAPPNYIYGDGSTNCCGTTQLDSVMEHFHGIGTLSFQGYDNAVSPPAGTHDLIRFNTCDDTYFNNNDCIYSNVGTNPKNFLSNFKSDMGYILRNQPIENTEENFVKNMALNLFVKY